MNGVRMNKVWYSLSGSLIHLQMATILRWATQWPRLGALMMIVGLWALSLISTMRVSLVSRVSLSLCLLPVTISTGRAWMGVKWPIVGLVMVSSFCVRAAWACRSDTGLLVYWCLNSWSWFGPYLLLIPPSDWEWSYGGGLGVIWRLNSSIAGQRVMLSMVHFHPF